MSQVRNLRAMFESKGDTSPPDRGRSPGVSSTASHSAVLNGAISPRPLSKVRTSFVAIEKDGRIGLRRDHSDESSLSRRLSLETDAESMSTLADKPVMAPSEDISMTARKVPIGDVILETSQQSQDTDLAVKALVTGTSVLPSDYSDDKTSERLSPPTLNIMEQSPQSPSNHAQAQPSMPTRAASVDKEADNQSQGPIRISKATTSNKGNMNRAAVGKQTAKMAKTHTSPTSTESTAKKEKPGDNRIAARNPTAVPKTAPVPTRPRLTPAATVKPKVTGRGEPSSVKSKPKSPTKAVHLPASILAPTASSVSKIGGPRQSLSGQGGYAQNVDISGKPLTRPSHSAATLVSASNAKSQPNPASHGRLSIGPPPNKRSQQEASAAKRQSQVDEGFLARMMRPTQASSSKTFDKPIQTVVKKTATVRTVPAAVGRRSGPDAGTQKKAVSKDATALDCRLSSMDIEVPHPSTEASQEAANIRAETATSSPRDASGIRTPVTPIDPEPAPESRPTEAMTSGSTTTVELDPVNTMGSEQLKDTHPNIPAAEDSDITYKLEPSVANTVSPDTASVQSADVTVVHHEAGGVIANTDSTTNSGPRSVFQPEHIGPQNEKDYPQSSDQDDISGKDIVSDGMHSMGIEIEDAADQIKHHEEETDVTTGIVIESVVDTARSKVDSVISH